MNVYMRRGPCIIKYFRYCSAKPAFPNTRLTRIQSNRNYIISKLSDVNTRYMEITGLNEVKDFQNRVTLIQEKLAKAQEVRRDASKYLSDIRERAREIQEQLQKIQRLEDPGSFIALLQEETKVLKRESDWKIRFQEIENAERDLFTQLSNSIRECHEKERTQAEYTKYWGITLSIIGTVLGAGLTLLLNSKRTRDLARELHGKSDDSIKDLKDYLENFKESLKTIPQSNTNETQQPESIFTSLGRGVWNGTVYTATAPYYASMYIYKKVTGR